MATLQPTLVDQNLTLTALLNSPSRFAYTVARRVDERLLTPTFLSSPGFVTQGGSVLYTAITRDSDFANGDPRERSVGAEYPYLSTKQLQTLANVRDLGANVIVYDEEVRRLQTQTIFNRVTQLANTVARYVDQLVLAAVIDALTVHNVLPVPAPAAWSALVIGGDPSLQTPNSDRPTASFAGAQALADADDLGVTYDTLVVDPVGAAELRTAYAENLNAVLESAGLTLKVTPHLTSGQALLVQAGAVGSLVFEEPLTIRPIPEPKTRSTTYQCFVAPAVVVSNPTAARLITGI